MRTLGNIIWHIPFLGFLNATIVYLLGALLTLTVVAAPVGLGLMEFGKFLFWPFGNAMVAKKKLGRQENTNDAWRMYSTVVMILYLPFGAVLACLAVLEVVGTFLSIIGIPVALVVAKSIGTYLNPVGKVCVKESIVEEMERHDAREAVASMRS